MRHILSRSRVTKVLASAAVAVAALGFTAPVQAQNLVTNHSFETGNFAGWTVLNNDGNTFVCHCNAEDGVYSAALGTVGHDATLEQWLPTVLGQTYNISFYLMNAGNPTNDFSAFFGGHQMFATSDQGPFSYFHFSYTATGSSPTLLQFNARQDPSWWYLDNIVVNGPRAPVPEPATWAMMLLGFGAIGFATRRRRRPVLAQVA